MIKEVFLDNSYKLSEEDVKNNSVLIDVGANIGTFSILAAKKGKCKVYAFEPHPENFKMLKENIVLNKDNLRGEIIPSDNAVSKDNSYIKFFVDPVNFAGSSIVKPIGKAIKVKAISLNEVFVKNKISHCTLLKLDVEGAEYPILYNAPKNILSRIKKIVLEYHDVFYLPEYNHEDLILFLKKNGFRTVHKKPYIFAYRDDVRER